jgi:phosphonopyruvate decarboxylase
VSHAVSFAAIARACGYRDATEGASVEALQAFLQGAKGPDFMRLAIRGGTSENLPRPGLKPTQVRQRLMRHLGISPSWAKNQ